MAICKNCGANIDESAKFCTTCGQPNTPSMPTMDTTVSGGYTEPTYTEPANTEPTQQQGSTNYGQTSYDCGYQQSNYGQSSYNGGYQQPQQNAYQQNTYGQPNYNGGAYQQPVNTVEPQKTNGMAITGFVMAICSAVLCCCGILAIPSLFFSIVGFKQTADGNQKGKGLALAGIIISAVVLVIWLISIILQATGVIDTNYYVNWAENNGFSNY